MIKAIDSGGALHAKGSANKDPAVGGDNPNNERATYIEFDARKSNSIYGSANTNQPSSLRALSLIRAH